MEYSHEQAVADGVNVGYDVYRIQTEITEKGSKVESGFFVDKRDKLTREIKNARMKGEKGLVHILIEGERIRSLTSEIPYAYSVDIDVDGRLVLPGLINVHMHLDKSGLTETIPNESGMITEARRKVLGAKPRITKEENARGSFLCPEGSWKIS
jgi:predicted amidohydrolase YtcJ